MSHLSHGELPSDTTIGGRWAIEAPLARGGMGTVYVARHAVTGQKAALKILDAGTVNEEAIARFQREAQTMAQVQHPGVVQIFDADQDNEGGYLYLAMELLQGRTLRGFMQDPSNSPSDVVDVIRAVLEPLAQAHLAGVVHRDLKPENIFVTDRAVAGFPVKLLDFGIAVGPSQMRMTRTGFAMGTPHYMAPEQALDPRSVGPQADIWSVGVMLYEALAGHVPFDADQFHALLVQLTTGEYTPLEPSERLDAELIEVVHRCLSREPSERFAHAGALRDELHRLHRRGSLPAPGAPPPDDSGVYGDSDSSTRAASLPAPAAANENGLGHPPAIPSAAGPAVLLVLGLLVAAGAVGLVVTGYPKTVALIGACLGLMTATTGLWLMSRRRAALRRWAAYRRAEADRAKVLDVPVEIVENPTVSIAPMHQAPALGPEHADVTVLVFGDLAAPRNLRDAHIIRGIHQSFPHRVRILYRHLPAPTRKVSRMAAEAGREVFAQGGSERFWAFHRLLASRPKPPQVVDLEAQAKGLQLDQRAFHRAIIEGEHSAAIEHDIEEARVLGLTAAPAFVVNGTVFEGAVSIATVIAEIRKWLPTGIETDEPFDIPVHEARTELPPGMLPVKVALRQILVQWAGARGAPRSMVRSKNNALSRAQAIMERASQPKANFEELAGSMSDEHGVAKSGGDMGVVVIEQLPSALGTAAQHLRLNEIAGPIETRLGFHIIQRYR